MEAETSRMTADTSREILVVTARVLAHEDDLGSMLSAILDTVARSFGIGSAAIVTEARRGSGLQIAAAFGLDERAAAGLTAAIADPSHPIARTFAAPTPTYDVAPVNPGGPALRSHLPLTVSRRGTVTVLGVLALAHDDPIDAATRPILEAAADLAAVAIERDVFLRGGQP
jgi:GAF domain-containing protein